MTTTTPSKSRFKRLLTWLLTPMLVLGFFSGIIFWGGFNWAMEATNNEQFCISCHEMKDNVYKEYQQTIHYSNRSGVRATCPDCHVPKDWTHKMIRKIQASNEVYHKILGSVDTPEKFEAKRAQLAQHVWSVMEATDSRECRNCHKFEFMDFTRQQQRAMTAHSTGLTEGKTCITCHKGIAHSLPNLKDIDNSAVLGTGTKHNAPVVTTTPSTGTGQ
ncbi:nitrate/TMAO reductase, membrane-bound tetraheme cytochrome c subunit [Beggiatoa alba B18LD]|uniref:Cytochrome c-type protein n=1 Tax=Beggiatoa alba B18LD TaxID=395493 RepID=I3CHX9_9GAMM|nr:NapC/NirT family cytochrome c [Beggiatoa alba]EIJ43222.1 nitrate/TMAO reductase, membrane-bound tetraheme cytochrome c subunit [Beggiatoa alba B18LD]